MTRITYRPTERQEQKWSKLAPVELPSDEEFRTAWAKRHHGKATGWGLGKRDWIVGNLCNHREYQMGLWQGRVDRARGLEYSEERSDAPYNLGYYRGYTDYESDRRGWDQATRERFDAEYASA